MRDHQMEGTPIAAPNRASKPRRRRRVSFMPGIGPEIANLGKGWPFKKPRTVGFSASFLDFSGLWGFKAATSRKEFLFDPPTGPGGRRSTLDSAMRPRARTCLEDPSS